MLLAPDRGTDHYSYFWNLDYNFNLHSPRCKPEAFVYHVLLYHLFDNVV
jgi:hypothetical protein